MRIELGAPIVIVELAGGLGESVYHLPAPTRIVRGRGGRPEREIYADATPDTWPSLCGLDGPVYGFNGPMRQRHACGICRAAIPAAQLTVDATYIDPEAERAPRRPSGKPKFVHSRLKPEHLRVLYEAKYLGEGLGVVRIGELIWERLGFASAKSAGGAVYAGFKAMGFELRSQSEGTALRNFKHGQSVRATRVEHGSGGYRRWLKEQRGAYQPICTAVSKRTRKRCTRPAVQGLDVCGSHDPARKAAAEARLAEMRSRSPLHDPDRLEPMRPLQEEMLAFYDHLGPGAWTALSPLTEMTPENLCRVARTKQQARIAKDKAAVIRRGMSELTTPALAAAA